MDVTAKVDNSADPLSVLQSTARGSLTLTPGGVGRNIAECASRLLGRDRVLLVSPIGGSRQESGSVTPDDLGKALLGRMDDAGMDTSGIIVREPLGGMERRTAGCSLVLSSNGDLTHGVADMSIVETLSADEIKVTLASTRPKLVAFDANIHPTLMQRILELSQELGYATLFEPTSIDKVGRIASCFDDDCRLTHFTPNSLELAKIAGMVSGPSLAWEPAAAGSSDISDVELEQLLRLTPWINHVWLKRGARGVLHFTTVDANAAPSNAAATSPAAGLAAVAVNYPAHLLDASQILSTTGAGDSFVGGLIAGLIEAESTPAAVRRAMQCATLSLQSLQAVSPSVDELKKRS